MKHVANWLTARADVKVSAAEAAPATAARSSKRPRCMPATATEGRAGAAHASRAGVEGAGSRHLPALAAAPCSTVGPHAEVEAKVEESMALLWRLHERTKTPALQRAGLLVVQVRPEKFERFAVHTHLARIWRMVSMTQSIGSPIVAV